MAQAGCLSSMTCLQARETSLQQALAQGRSKAAEVEAAEDACRRLEEVRDMHSSTRRICIWLLAAGVRMLPDWTLDTAHHHVGICCMQSPAQV